MNKLWLPALLVTGFGCTGAIADHRYEPRFERHDFERHHFERHHGPRHQHHRPPVFVREVYAPVVYRAPPVFYREPVLVREQPVYYEAAPRYEAPPRRHSYQGGNRLVGQTVGVVAGGLIGSTLAHGDARIATTVLGAAVGGVVGGRLADNGY